MTRCLRLGLDWRNLESDSAASARGKQARAEQHCQAPPDSEALSTETQRLLGEAGQKITSLWKANELSLTQQKALVRCLVEKVVVQRLPGAKVQVRIVWKGNDTSTTAIPVRAASWSDLPYAAEVETTIARLTRAGKSDQEIAAELTAQGFRSARTNRFSAHMVLRIRLRQRVLRDPSQSRVRSFPGCLTVAQLADRLRISPFAIYDRIARGTIGIDRDPRWQWYLVPDKPQTITMMQRLLAGQIQKFHCKGGHQDR